MSAGSGETGDLTIDLLGPVELRVGGELVAVPAGAMRVVLAALALDAGQVVPVGVLVDALWGQQDGRSREQNLQAHIYQLRRRLHAADPARAGALLVTRPPGYVLNLGGQDTDVSRFDALAARGRELARADPAGAGRVLGEALRLWRGPALADVAGLSDRLAAAAARLEELRLGVLEDRIQADLDAGMGLAAVTAELGGYVREHPLRERLAGQHMLALFRAGRQGESLAAYQRVRRVLIDELGVEPGPELRALHQRVLDGEPALLHPDNEVHPPATPTAAQMHAWDKAAAAGSFAAAATRALPRDAAAFTGREEEVARLMQAAVGPASSGGVIGIHAIGGMAGVGKTALAVHAAHRLAASFPDGQFYLPLHAHTAGHRPVDPSDALASLLLTAGVPAQHIPPGLEARAGRWRDHVAGKRILILLDDAVGHDQVQPLLPGSAGSLVLITSRRRLTAIADANVISLDTLPPDQAATLLARLSGRPQLAEAAGPAAEITQLCGYLPLAIAMIASQLRHHPARTAAEVTEKLASARSRLAVLTAENLSVAAAFDLSYADLTTPEQQLFRRLGLVPGQSFDAYAAAALTNATPDAAGRLLDELFDQHLLTEPRTGQYQLHDLLREHARTLVGAEAPCDTDAASLRLLDYYVRAANMAGGHFGSWITYTLGHVDRPPGCCPELSTLEQATAWLEAQRANLQAAAEFAAASGQHSLALQIVTSVSAFLVGRGPWHQASALLKTGLAAARRAGDQRSEAAALNGLGLLALLTADYPAASRSLQDAVALFAGAGDLPGQTYALNELGFAQALTGDYPSAVTSYRQALSRARVADDQRAEADSLNGLGFVQQLTGDYSAATTCQQQALALFGDLGDLKGQASALNDLGVIQQETGDLEAAAASQRRVLQIERQVGDQLGQALALNDLGVVQREMRHFPAAASSHLQALALFVELGYRLGHAEALNRLGEVKTCTGATADARDHHTQALSIAEAIGVPFEQARALAGLGQSWLCDEDRCRAEPPLRQALAIYERIGAIAAVPVEELLSRNGFAPNRPCS